MKKPELLAPVGDLEKLEVACRYGADAVYLGGLQYSLRAGAKNFDNEQMVKSIKYAHNHGKKVYVAANIFAHNSDFEGMPEFLQILQELEVDGIIVSDAGVFSMVKKYAKGLSIHISTQANTTNYHAARFWHEMGAGRVILARELSLGEVREVYENMPAGFEVEVFVHGAMCVAYSGRCLLSQVLTGRSANKGACAQPCRWKYHLMEETRPGEYMPVSENEQGSYIYSAKDLCMIEHIPELVATGAASFKIEGRMKSPYYVATVVKAYREAIDDYFDDPALYKTRIPYYLEEIKKCSHRAYSTGFYFKDGKEAHQMEEAGAYIRTYDFVGMVLEYDSNRKMALVEQRNKMLLGDEVEIFRAKGKTTALKLSCICDEKGLSVTSAPHPQQRIWVAMPPVERYDMLRKAVT